MRLRICEVMQECDKLSENLIKDVVSRPCIKEYAYIKHDKDKDKDG